MQAFLNEIVAVVSPAIGFVGILIIAFGVFYSVWIYLSSKHGHSSCNARIALNQHLILGLDFLVGKDIMDTFLLHSGSAQWIDLATIMIVVTIRIVLSHFLEKEIKSLKSG